MIYTQICHTQVSLPSAKKPIQLVPISDVHLGSAGCEVDLLKETVDYICKHPHCYTVLLGDLVDMVIPNDKRFDFNSMSPEYCLADLSDIINKQVRDIISILKPLAEKKKIWAAIEGNHEHAVRKHLFSDPTAAICTALKVPYLGASGFLRVNLHTQWEKAHESHNIDIFLSHGYGAGRKSGGKLNKLKDVASFFSCDLVLLGHDHERMFGCFKRIGISQDSLGTREENTYCVICGCFLRGYVKGSTTYVEQKLYQPTSMGSVKINIIPRGKQISVLI